MLRSWLLLLSVGLPLPATVTAGTKTWDGRHATDEIAVTVVYFVPRDRSPLPDWKERVDYFCRRIEAFHEREFSGQSVMRATAQDTPFVSQLETEQLRPGDGDAIFFRTLREVDEQLQFGRRSDGPFPILLVLSEINWRPLDDFYRLQPTGEGPRFEGNYGDEQHFPGAASGGARATYLADQRKGWGLVSADGWRVPYRGSDCVVYHEGCGHTVGLPHPEPGNGSVMSLGQYQGWISESWLDRDQKSRLGWSPPAEQPDRSRNLFDHFRALPEPRVPLVGMEAFLALDWPEGAQIEQLRVRYQTDEYGPWVEVPVEHSGEGSCPDRVLLGSFDRPTPISYRVDVRLQDGQQTELWGYLQVRQAAGEVVLPGGARRELITGTGGTGEPALEFGGEVDLLPLIDPERDAVSGNWTVEEGRLVSSKGYGHRIEIPVDVPDEYRLTVIVEPLDEPNGLLFGQILDDRRFVTLLSYTPGEEALSALENVNGENVGNFTTHRGPVFLKGRLSQVLYTIRNGAVSVDVDGQAILRWQGLASELSLSDYWTTPRADRLFIGAYDCRYRIHRLTLAPLVGGG